MALPKLGIIAGQGRLAAYLIDACKAAGRSFFVLALDGHADRAALGDLPHAWILRWPANPTCPPTDT